MQQIHPKSDVSNSFSYHLCALIALALTGIIAYLPVSLADLLSWDTQTYINDNLAIHQISGSSLWWMLTQTYHANWHPLTWLSHALDIKLFGFVPFGHHWVSVAWHIACSFLLYLYSRQLLHGLMPARFEQNGLDIYLVSLFAALLFALHPQHTESVAWVAERKDVLCAFFYLLCLYNYHNYIARPRFSGYALTLCCAAAAIMAKPMAVSIPAVLVLLDILLYRRGQVFFWRRQDWRLVLLEKIPFIMLALLSSYLTLQGQTSSGAVNSLDAISIGQRLASSLVNWAEYLTTTLIPVGLSPYYPYAASISWPKLLLSLTVLISLVAVADFFRRRNTSWPMLALGYYTITLLPVIGIVQIGTIRAADRYTYLPTIPVYLIAAVLLYGLFKLDLSKRQTVKRALPRLLCLLIIPLALGASTHQYTKIWQNNISLWEFVTDKEPDNIYSAIYLAEAYYHAKRYHEALPLYRRAYHNRQLISPQRRLNIFINRYFDTAFQLELYREAEIAIFTSMQENRLWFLSLADIYYNAAVVSIELSKLETALQLAEMAEQNGANDEKLRLLKKRIADLIESPQ